MTLRHLEIFLRVCDEENMTRAAQKLHMTQPSVSQAIRELESHYSILLFERLGRRLFITQAGERLLTYARHLVNLHAQSEEAMREFGSLYHVRLGASVTIGECLLIGLILRLNRTYPKNRITSVIQNTAVLEQMLLADELDIALVEGHVASEYLRTIPFFDDELIFIAGPHDDLAKQPTVRTDDLENIPFFIREEGSGTRRLMEQVFERCGVKYCAAGIYNNAETIKKAVAAGLGISVISEAAVRCDLEAGRLQTFCVESLRFRREFRMVYHKNKYLSQEMRSIIAFCERLREENLK